MCDSGHTTNEIAIGGSYGIISATVGKISWLPLLNIGVDNYRTEIEIFDTEPGLINYQTVVY